MFFDTDYSGTGNAVLALADLYLRLPDNARLPGGDVDLSDKFPVALSQIG